MYPLYGPPHCAGLYTVKNKKTGQTYLGQTVDLGRRYREWRGIISTGLRMPNNAADAAIKSSEREDWEFRVLMECPASELKRMEERAIARLVADLGPLCLNVPDAGVRRPKAKSIATGCLSLSEVLDENGVAMSHAEIAVRLGITMDSVQKRLARARRVGRFKFDIGDLPARQQRLPGKNLA